MNPTKTADDQWRARILRALEELQPADVQVQAQTSDEHPDPAGTAE